VALVLFPGGLSVFLNDSLPQKLLAQTPALGFLLLYPPFLLFHPREVLKAVIDRKYNSFYLRFEEKSSNKG
jgi:hypothetical protein